MDPIAQKDKSLKVKKFLSFVLQHKPFFYKVRIDDGGFADIHYLTLCIKKKLNIDITKEEIVIIAKRFSGGIFKLNESEDRIAAKSGHTFTFNSKIPEGFELTEKVPSRLYCNMNSSDFYACLGSDTIPLSNHKIILTETQQGRQDGEISLEINTKKVAKKSEFYYNKTKGYYARFLTKDSVALHV